MASPKILERGKRGLYMAGIKYSSD